LGGVPAQKATHVLDPIPQVPLEAGRVQRRDRIQAIETLQLLDQPLLARGLVPEARPKLLGNTAAVQEGIETPLDALLHRRESRSD
jgi:hypothetical protein